MDLSTTYLGLKLPHPLVVGASPLGANLDGVRRLEDAGAAAIVLHSLFEEQLVSEQLATFKAVEAETDQFAEARSFLPSPEEYRLGPDEYLEHIRKIKAAVRTPLIASLNGVTPGGWLSFAKSMQQAGADALELNVYLMATDASESGVAVEDRTVQMAKAVKAAVKIPVAIKLSPYYTSVAHFAGQLDKVGIDGLVVFNRLYQPDIDVEELEVHRVNLSSSSELLLRLRWLAILSPKVKASLAVTGGVHTSIDAVKAIMAGAHAVQMVSALLERGPRHLAAVKRELEHWLEEHEYESVNQMRGCMNLQRCPDPAAYERANYVRVLQSWKV